VQLVQRMSLRTRYLAAPDFREFIDLAEKNAALWATQARLAKVGPEAVERVAALGGSWHLLVLNEDWCGDAVNTLPYIARLAELAPNVDLRVLGRDANPDLMDAHLTGASRSIPVVSVLDERYEERGWWGPRPAPLQAWVHTEGRRLDPVEKYREVRRWYARDRGATTIAELVALLERAASATRLGAA